MPEETKKITREERVSIAVPKRKVSPPPEGIPAHGLIYELTSLKQYPQSLKPATGMSLRVLLPQHRPK